VPPPRAGTAADNARLYAERSEIARTLQGALRPPALPAMPGWSAAAVYEPAGRANEVGGDFYDVFAVAGGWMLVIGDVIGKGAPAAALTSLARYSIRTAATLTGSPAEALRHLNDDLQREGQDALLSALCVRLTDTPDGACAVIASAGHPLPLHVRDGVATPAGRGSLLLGVAAHTAFAEHEIDLGEGDALVLYTDGVLDARGAHDRFGQERLVAALSADGDSADDAVACVVAALEGFQHGGQADDITLLAVRRREAA
jgi:serine phosphatase RsbU (regulator of sigma subunit)